MNNDLSAALQDQVRRAASTGCALDIRGGGSQPQPGNPVQGEAVNLAGHTGIIDYAPEELVITVRSGTSLTAINALLAEHGQMLAFEPPVFSTASTIGGAIACNRSGAARPWAGAARDSVLGCQILDGQGQQLNFGGQVMKNVAGYDVSRLMCGAHGTLGILLSVSLKVLPIPPASVTLVRACGADEAIDTMNRLCGKPLPLTGAAWLDNQLHLRLGGSPESVHQATRQLSEYDRGPDIWSAISNLQHPFFDPHAPLWRLAVTPTSGLPALSGQWLIDWAGGQRWLISPADATTIRQIAAAAGGHAQRWHAGDAPLFQPIPAGMLALHRRLKQVFDPLGILNPGRLYAEL